MKKKNSVVEAKYTESGSYIGAYPSYGDKYEFPTKCSLEDAFLHGSVASANDCTGVAVVPPTTEEEGESIAELHRGIPVTYKKDNNEPASRPAPER